MKPKIWHTVLFNISTVAMLIPLVAVAQDATLSESEVKLSSDSQKAPDLTVQEVQSRLNAIEENPEIEETVKGRLRSKYQEAIASLTEAATNSERAARFREAMSQAPILSSELQKKLKELPPAVSFAEVKQPSNLDEFQQELNRKRGELAALNEELSSVTDQLSDGEQRPAEISARIPEVQRELSKLHEEIAEEDLLNDETTAGRIADRFVLLAQQAKLVSELDMLEQEQLSMSVRRSLLQTREDLLTRQVENTSAAVAAYEATLDQSVTKRAQALITRVTKIKTELPEKHPALELVAEVQKFAKDLTDVLKDKLSVSVATTDSTVRLQRLIQQYEGITKQLELGQPDREMAEVLLKLRDLLEQSGGDVAQQPLYPTLSQTRLAAVLVDSAIDRQSIVQEEFAGQPSKAIEELIFAREEVLTMLRDQYLELLPDLATLETEEKLYSDRAGEVRDDITQQLFWMKLSPPLSISTFSDSLNGFLWVCNPKHGQELAVSIGSVIKRAEFQSFAILLISVVLLLIKPWLRIALKRSGEGVGHVSKDRYALTGKALLWTLLLALPIPMLFGFVAFTIPETGSSLNWQAGIRIGMRSLTSSVFAASLIIACCTPGGLGQKHFGWRTDLLPWLRQASYLFLIAYVPLVLATCCTFFGETAKFLDSIGRLSFIIAHIALAMFLRKLFFSSKGPLANNDGENRTSFFYRLCAVLIVFCPIGLVILAWAGYMVAAMKLSYLLAYTLSMIVGIVILYGCALRRFKIAHRKMALAEALERRKNRREAAMAQEQQDESDEVISVDEDEQELDIDTIDEQMRHLVRLVFGVGTFIALVPMWSETLPLVEFFESVKLPVLTELSLLDLTKAALIVGVSWIAIQNLPGVLEFAVLRSTSIHAGTRNAITTIGQYVLFAIGLTLLFTVLKLDWSQFGWIAGGLSVGIGFGMQEIVANFVCGLILLFERPVRVGDVVTLEGEIGTVTKIHLRATTITNFDRGEVVLPNKTLITSKFVNWTLSSTLNRLTIPVGVAYGTDSEQARQILLDVAAAHPNVSTDPAPVAIFSEFADSSLNILLRVYLPDRNSRESTFSELHTEIDKRLTAAGIEIPFPQRDLHLRSGGSQPFSIDAK